MANSKSISDLERPVLPEEGSIIHYKREGLRKWFREMPISRPLFAVCCQIQLDAESVNRFLNVSRDFAENAFVSRWDGSERMLVVVEDLAEVYNKPTYKLEYLKLLPFEGQSIQTIHSALFSAVFRTESRYNPKYFVVLDAQFVEDQSVLLVESDLCSDRLCQTVRVSEHVCSVELANLWTGQFSMRQLQEHARDKANGILSYGLVQGPVEHNEVLEYCYSKFRLGDYVCLRGQ